MESGSNGKRAYYKERRRRAGRRESPGACGCPGSGRNWACGRIRGTVFRMKTTFNIDDNVMRELRTAAAREGATLSALVEAAIRNLLASMARPKPSGKLKPLPSWDMGPELVDVADREALYAAMGKK